MRELLKVYAPGEELDVTIGEDEFGDPILLADPIPLTADRAMTLATALIEWAKEQSK